MNRVSSNQQNTSSSSSSFTSKQSLLRDLALSTLSYSLLSSLFYAERLYALDPSIESSVFLLSSIQFRLDQPHQALHLLRQSVSFNPNPNATAESNHGEDLFGGPAASSRTSNRWTTTNTSGKLSRPTIECSVRCARLYGQICSALGRDKEGRQALFRVLQPSTPLVSTSSEPLEPSSSSSPTSSAPQAEESTMIDLELARLARKGGENERAVQSYSKVLSKLPTCWEALETLCQMGAPPTDIDSIYPVRPRPIPISSQAQQPPAQPHSPLPMQPLRSHPPPLGPSLNAAVNAPVSFGRPRNGDMQDTPLSYATPAESNQGGGWGPLSKGNVVGGGGGGAPGGGLKGKGKEVWMVGAAGGGLPLRRTASGRYGDVTETSIDEA